MDRISPDHPAVKRLAVAICEVLAAWHEITRFQGANPPEGALAQNALPADTPILSEPEARQIVSWWLGHNRLTVTSSYVPKKPAGHG